MKSERTFWDRFAFAYDVAEALNAKVYRTMISRIASLVEQDDEVLECAAGTGAISIAIAPKAKRVLCTDLSQQMLDKAERKAAAKGLRNIVFDVRDLMRLPDNDECFDVVIAANVIHLLDDPGIALRELWRVTRKGGRLIVPTFLTGNINVVFTALIGLYRLLGFRPKHDFTEDAYRSMLKQSGLPNARIEIIPGRIPVGFAVFEKSP